MYSYSTAVRQPNCAGTVPDGLIHAAYDECVEMRTQPFMEVYQRVRRHIEAHQRLEITVTLYEEIVGQLILVSESDDPHVGPCATIQWAYVLPDHRRCGAELYRMAYRAARKLQHKVLSYTHREAAGVYTHRYRRL